MTALYKPRPERWPQFSLRELLIGVTLAALLMSWAIAEYRRPTGPPISPYLNLLNSNNFGPTEWPGRGPHDEGFSHPSGPAGQADTMQEADTMLEDDDPPEPPVPPPEPGRKRISEPDIRSLAPRLTPIPPAKYP